MIAVNRTPACARPAAACSLRRSRPVLGLRQRSLATPAQARRGRTQPRTMAQAAQPADGQVARGENFVGTVTEPSVANKNWVRLAASIAAVAVAARGTALLPAKGAAFVHLFAYAFNTGMILWVTLIAGLTMFKNMSRQAFGKVQAKLFPKYFAVSVFTLALQIGTLAYALPGGLQREQLTSLGIALAASLVNWIIEPRGTAVLMQRYALESAEGPKDKERIAQLKSAFTKFHGLSSLLNLVVLVAIVAHGYWLSSLLAFA